MINFYFRVTLILLFLSNVSLSEIVRDIKVEGNQRLSEKTIINFSEIKINDDINENILNKALKNLYESNFFSDVKLNINKNILNITVQELPIVQKIEIKGIKSSKQMEDFKDIMSLKEKNPFNANNIANDVNTLLNILKRSGFYFAEISTFTENNPNNTVNLIFDIDRGERAIIKNINFIGDKKFKDKKLYSIITSEEGKFWKFLSKKKFLNIDSVNFDKRLLTNFYKEKGYYDVKINDAYSQVTDQNDFDLIFNIDAGKIYYFGDFKLNIPLDFNEIKFDKLNKTLSEIKGKKYNYKDIEKILDEIENISIEQNVDFIDADVIEDIFDDKVNFTINLKDSKKIYIGRIDIFGNNITSEKFIRNQLIIDEGDPYNKILFNKSINKLKASKLFKSVKANNFDTKDNIRNIDLTLEEQPTGEIFAAAGYGTDGSSFSVGIKENNFNGEGIGLETELNLSEDAIKGSFSYTTPNFLYSEKSLTSSVQSTSTDKLTDFGYKSSLNKISVSTRYEQFKDTYFSPLFSISTERIETNNTASNALKKQEGSYFEGLFGYSLSYDKRNSPFQPSSGFISSFSQNIPLITDDGSLYNSYSISIFKEPVDNLIISTGFYVGSINSVSNEDVRISKRLYAPSSRLRGFKSGKVGPKDGDDFVGGNYVSTFNLSSTLPYLFENNENLEMKGFIDFGNVWGVDYSSTVDDSNKIRSSAGLAFELFTPVGPLTFSYAEVFTKNSTDETENFRFQLGTTF